MPLHQDLMHEDSEEEPDMNWLRESADKVRDGCVGKFVACPHHET